MKEKIIEEVSEMEDVNVWLKIKMIIEDVIGYSPVASKSLYLYDDKYEIWIANVDINRNFVFDISSGDIKDLSEKLEENGLMLKDWSLSVREEYIEMEFSIIMR